MGNPNRERISKKEIRELRKKGDPRLSDQEARKLLERQQHTLVFPEDEKPIGAKLLKSFKGEKVTQFSVDFTGDVDTRYYEVDEYLPSSTTPTKLIQFATTKSGYFEISQDELY